MAQAPMPYGDARLFTEGAEDISRAFAGEGSAAVVLGIDAPDKGTGLLWAPKGEQGHALTLGATRSGKGVRSIIPALLTYAGSMVVIDPKGENAWVTAERRRQMGQRVVILDPWGEVNRRYAGGEAVERTTLFNPLSAIDPNHPDFNDEITAIADALVVTEGGSESHWTDSAREMIAGLVAAVTEMRPGEASLGDVRELIAQPSEELAKTIKEVVAARPNSLGERKLRRFAKDGREVDSIRSTAMTQTAVFDSRTLQAAMQTDATPFDLAELGTGAVTLYLVLPLDRLQTHGRWLRLILTLAIRVISRQATAPAMPVLFMLDEMGTVGKLAMIEQAFGLMAGIGVRVWGFLQDLNQLKRDYPQSWETFISNSSVVQVLNARDSTTSEYFANYLGSGTYTVNQVSKSDNALSDFLKPSDPENRMPFSVGNKTSSTGYYSRPVLFPYEVRLLGDKEIIIIKPGRGAVKIQPIVYHEDLRFRGLFRPLPWFPIVERRERNIPTIHEAVQFLKDEGWEVQSKGVMSRRWTVSRPGQAGAKELANDAALVAFANALS